MYYLLAMALLAALLLMSACLAVIWIGESTFLDD